MTLLHGLYSREALARRLELEVRPFVDNDGEAELLDQVLLIIRAGAGR